MYYIMINQNNNHWIAACCGTEATAKVLLQHAQTDHARAFIVQVADSHLEEFEAQWDWLD